MSLVIPVGHTAPLEWMVWYDIHEVIVRNGAKTWDAAGVSELKETLTTDFVVQKRANKFICNFAEIQMDRKQMKGNNFILDADLIQRFFKPKSCFSLGVSNECVRF